MESVLIVSVPSAKALFVYDARTMGELGAPLVVDRAGSNPVRLAIAERFDWLLVGLEGGSRLGAYELPARTVSFALPTMRGCLPPRCEMRGWSMLLAPAYDRVYLFEPAGRDRVRGAIEPGRGDRAR